MASVRRRTGLGGAIGATLLAAGALAGCAPAAAEIAALDREPTADDAMPAQVEQTDDLDADSTRLLAAEGDVAYYVSRGPEVGYCLTIVDDASEDQWVTGCGGVSDVTVSGAGGHVARLVLSMPDDPPGRPVGDNLIVFD